MSVIEAFGNIAEILAKMNPEAILKLQAPPSMNDRVAVLIEKKKETELDEEEAIELERYLTLDLLISLTKARANKLLAA